MILSGTSEVVCAIRFRLGTGMLIPVRDIGWIKLTLAHARTVLEFEAEKTLSQTLVPYL